MDIKQRIIEVLRVPVTDEQCEEIRQNYPQFYNSPEEYMADTIIPVILDDLDFGRSSGLKALMNTVEGMDIKYSDSLHTLLWGTYHGTFLYAIPVNGEYVEQLRGLSTEMGMGDAGNDELIAEVMFSNDNESALVVVRKRGDIATVGELPFTISNAMPGYSKGFCRRLFHRAFPDCLSSYYVPFIPSGNGFLPVMWIDRSTGFVTGRDLGDQIASEYQDIKVGVYDEHFKEMYKSLKSNYPSVDLNSDAKNRYALLSYRNYNFVYNRNHLAYNGNLPVAQCILPMLLAFMLDIDRLQSNVFDVVLGLSDWSSLYYRRFSEQDEAEHRAEIDEWNKQNHPGIAAIANGEAPAYSDTRGEGTRKSVLGKMFDNASSDYKQV